MEEFSQTNGVNLNQHHLSAHLMRIGNTNLKRYESLWGQMFTRNSTQMGLYYIIS